MANVPPSSPTASSDSQGSTTHLVQPKEEVDDGPMQDKGACDVFEKKPEPELPPFTMMNDFILPKPESPRVRIPPHFDNFSGSERNMMFQKCEADYTRYLMSKHFSDKDIYGDDIFEGMTIISGETIMSSRRRPTETYLKPGLVFEEESSSSSSLTAETGEDASSGQIVAIKEEPIKKEE